MLVDCEISERKHFLHQLQYLYHTWNTFKANRVRKFTHIPLVVVQPHHHFPGQDASI